MPDKPIAKTLLISDFNVQNLAGYLSNAGDNHDVAAETAPFGQVVQILSDFSQYFSQYTPDYLVVWTFPQQFAGLKNYIEYENPSSDAMYEAVDNYCQLLRRAAEKVKALFVPAWGIPSYCRGLGIIDLKSDQGLAYALMRANIRLIENLKSVSNIYVMNSQRWCEQAGARNAHNPKLWHMGKIGFGNEVFKEAASDIRAAIRSLSGYSRKLVIVDLDDTLWGGIIGDIGRENLNLGGHDPVGEAFVDFQHRLKALKNRGILLAIASKNEESIAMSAISQHPEMILRPDDFAAWRINWQDKASNIVELVKELNLGLQSVVFIDDNPVERSRVREALPEVFVPEWPEDKLLYSKALLELNCFDTPGITDEDMVRTQMYVAGRKREASLTDGTRLEDWLKSLQTKVTVECLDSKNLTRAAQLFNKTNQMNLATRRMPENELLKWATRPGRYFWTFRVADKFGDAGLTGLASLEVNGSSATIVDFILSCRIIGRNIEQTILHFIEKQALIMNIRELLTKYVATEKNQVCHAFWLNNSGFTANPDKELFSLQLHEPASLPEGIELIYDETL